MVLPTWNGDSYPDGDKSMPDNRVGIGENFDYIEGALERDHFWTDDSEPKNGYHRHVSIVTAGDDTDPGVPAGTNGITFIKTLDTDKQVLHHDDGTTIRPLSWGTVWAWAVFDPDGSASPSPTITRSSNIDTAVGITYSGGVFTFTFVKEPPTADYMVYGSTTYKVSAQKTEYLITYGEDGSNLTTTTFKVAFVNQSGTISTTTAIATSQAHVMVIV